MTDKETMAIIKQMVADGQISQEVAEKYFPELKEKESEDEKIRKELIEYLKERKSCESYGQYVVRCDRWIAWLEKKGEQNPNPCDGCINRKGCINCENGELREVEQKPVWSEEDKYMLYGIMETESYMLDVVNRIKEFDVGNDDIRKACTKELDWLKSLKDRVQPQLKQEWSEWDRILQDSSISYLCNLRDTFETKGWDKGQIQKCINWLNSLRPNHWKPTEEQIEALRKAEATIGVNHVVLASLIYDLEKLMK